MYLQDNLHSSLAHNSSMREKCSRVQAAYLAEKSRMVKVLERHEDIEAATRDVEEVCIIPWWYVYIIICAYVKIASVCEKL